MFASTTRFTRLKSGALFVTWRINFQSLANYFSKRGKRLIASLFGLPPTHPASSNLVSGDV